MCRSKLDPQSLPFVHNPFHCQNVIFYVTSVLHLKAPCFSYRRLQSELQIQITCTLSYLMAITFQIYNSHLMFNPVQYVTALEDLQNPAVYVLIMLRRTEIILTFLGTANTKSFASILFPFHGPDQAATHLTRQAPDIVPDDGPARMLS